MPILAWARRITSSGVCRESRSFSSASLESTATRKQGSSSSRSPPIMATTCGRLRRFCWRWRPCARRSQKWLALSLTNSSRNSPKTRFLLVSWPSSRFLLPRLFPLNSEFFLSRMCFSSLCIWCWYLERHGTARSNFCATRYVCRIQGYSTTAIRQLSVFEQSCSRTDQLGS